MRAVLRLLTVSWLTAGAVAGAEIHPEFALDSDPELKIPEPIHVFPTKHQTLWLKALARPEADLQRRAAEAIAKAQLIGFPNLDEAKPTLTKIVSANTSHPAARLSAARALIVLEADDAAATLFEASQRHGTDMRQLIEPALAKWNYQPIREIWQQRLTSRETRHRDLMLAIDGVREVYDGSAVPALIAIVQDSLRPTATRLAAARSAGRLRNSGLEPIAERLIKPASASIPNRLCAVALLDQHRHETSQAVLLELAREEEPSVAAAALTVLNATDHRLVLPLAEQALHNADANVRQQGIAAYVALPTPERVTALARLLDDPHPGVRGRVRESLFLLARTAELDAPIRQTATDVLAGESWRGQEQAALLLAVLDHKPAAARLVLLLESPREEVMVASAWGLRKLAVPETLPAILDKAMRQTELRTQRPVSLAFDAQVAHLCEALGLLKYAPAKPLLQRYIAKNYAMGELSRGSAIWALGHLHAGVPEEPLAQLVYDRVAEPSSAIPPEVGRVRIAGAISLGRMRANTYAARLKNLLGPTITPDQRALALRWAIQEMTGETLPEAEPAKISHAAGWFLEPLE